MDQLRAMRIFARVARLESFSGAARELRISATAASRAVAELESQLGTQLLSRTTRRTRPTQLGTAYLERCERILVEIDEIEAAVSADEQRVSGKLRLTAGVDFGREHVVPLLPALLEAHPSLEVEVALADRLVDLIGEGFDLAVRVGVLEDSSLIARRLATSRMVLVASPDYLARRGTPEQLSDLTQHDAVLDTNLREARWLFETPSGLQAAMPPSRLALNSPHAIRDVVRDGFGIAMVPRFAVAQDLREGRLVQILCETPGREIGIFALVPPTRQLSGRVRACVDFLVDAFSEWHV
jgi:DNA-binding transcriptional LysR family regulator